MTVIPPARSPLRGRVRVPGDKSISHRAAILAALAPGPSQVVGFSQAGDCEATLAAVAALGAAVERDGGTISIRGPGSLRAPSGTVGCGRSATTMRLLTGAIASFPVRAVLDGDPQLGRRPMARVAEPLRRMGARIELTGSGAPMLVEGGALRGIEHRSAVASAQVKSALLLAGLRAEGTTTVEEPVRSRDHTERLLTWLGAGVRVVGNRVSVEASRLEPFRILVPGDLSSAAPVLAAAAVVPASEVVVEGVGLNPTRTAFLDVIERMGAVVEAEPGLGEPEPAGDVRVAHAPLRAVELGEAEVPGLIDELPLLGVVAALAEGETVVRGASELRVKESDRIAGLVAGLRALGADAEELSDGFVVRGPARLRGGACDARGDHRLAMAFAVAGFVADAPVRVVGMEMIADSFPGFLRVLEAVA